MELYIVLWYSKELKIEHCVFQLVFKNVYGHQL